MNRQDEVGGKGAGAGHKCPVCRVDLVMSERQNIEIDYCPQCRGIWLDRGELDKIIERSAGQFAQAGSGDDPSARDGREASRHGRARHGGGHGSHGGRHGSQGGALGWLSDIFH